MVDMDAACQIAQQVKAWRKGLAAEEANLADHPTYVRAKKYREQDAARYNGMVIALTFVLGKPMDLPNAEKFIEEVTS